MARAPPNSTTLKPIYTYVQIRYSSTILFIYYIYVNVFDIENNKSSMLFYGSSSVGTAVYFIITSLNLSKHIHM